MFWVSLVRVSSEKEKISSYAERPPTGAKNNPDAEYKICPQEARDSEDAYGWVVQGPTQSECTAEVRGETVENNAPRWNDRWYFVEMGAKSDYRRHKAQSNQKKTAM